MGVPLFVVKLLSLFGESLLRTFTGLHTDNLYLDGNGIVHPCARENEYGVYPKTEEEKIKSCLRYIEILVGKIQPKKLLFISLDGVAPRAKMNQQRTRRFLKNMELETLMEVAQEQVRKKCTLLEEIPAVETDWDTNAITPGTEFMQKLSYHMKTFIHLKVQEDPHWKHLKVIFSDSSVPGEGEHKIFSYIRRQRMDPHYNHNTVHMINGLDADLFMLALQTHEENIYLLREENKNQKIPWFKRKLNILSLYDFRYQLSTRIKEWERQLKFSFNLERVIDDIVALVSLLGNDFIPHVPTLELQHSGLNDILKNYPGTVKKTGGYLTTGIHIHFKRLQYLLKTIAKQELNHCKTIEKKEERSQRGNRGTSIHTKKLFETTIKKMDEMQRKQYFEKKVKAEYEYLTIKNRPTTVRVFGKHNFKEEYYKKKLQSSDVTTICKEYLIGLLWVWRYYCHSLASWSWYYPYYFAPFASDIISLSEQDIEEVEKTSFSLDMPLHPFTQLVSVLPRGSCHCLPKPHQIFMHSEYMNEFFPESIERDKNYAHADWKAVCIIPFVDIQRIAEETKKLDQELTPEERNRNTFGFDIIYFNKAAKKSQDLLEHYERSVKKFPALSLPQTTMKLEKELFSRISDNSISGFFYQLSSSYIHEPVIQIGQSFSSLVNTQQQIINGDVISSVFFYPSFPYQLTYIEESEMPSAIKSKSSNNVSKQKKKKKAPPHEKKRLQRDRQTLDQEKGDYYEHVDHIQPKKKKARTATFSDKENGSTMTHIPLASNPLKRIVKKRKMAARSVKIIPINKQT